DYTNSRSMSHVSTLTFFGKNADIDITDSFRVICMGHALEEHAMANENDYLKQYVKQRPDNQMAWYLLGKQYEAENKLGKAKYCFLQSGEVYEAFEKKALEVDDPQVEKEAMGFQRSTVNWRMKWWTRFGFVFFLLLAAVVFAPQPKEEGQELSQ